MICSQSGLLQHFRNRFDRSDTHDLRRHTGDAIANEARQRRKAKFLQRFFADKNHRAGAIAGLRTIAGGHGTLRGEHRAKFREALQRRIGTRTFVFPDGFAFRHNGVIREVGELFVDGVGQNLAELAGLGCLDRFLVTGECEGILIFAAHLPTLGDFFRRQTHAISNADVFVFREHGIVDRHLVAAHGNHAHGFRAGADHDVGCTGANAIGGNRHCFQSRGAETIHRQACDRLRNAREQQPDARNVHTLFRFGNCTADNHIGNLLRVEARYLRQRAAQYVREQIIGPRIAEHTARRLAHRRSAGGDYVGVVKLFHI